MTAVQLSLIAISSACAGPPPGSDAAVSPVAATRNLAPCRAMLARPEDLASVAAVVRHINALPQPATVACVLASLPRPLSVVATTSVTSAQPAVGSRSPRIFILSPAITLSVVAEGDGADLLEFGEWIDARRSVKGELMLPSTQALAPTAPFDRVRYRDGTTCGFCHREESAAPDGRGAFASVAFRPMVNSLVALDELRGIPATVCTGDDDVSVRCVFWHALFDYGEIRPGAFNPGVETIFR